MRGWIDDLRHAWRSVMRQPVFTTFAALTLALGVGATTTIYSTLEAVVLRPIPYEGADRMVALFTPIGNSGALRTPTRAQVDAWSGMTDVFERIEPMGTRSMTLVDGVEPTAMSVGLIQPSFHAFAGRTPVLGRSFTDDELRTEANVLLIGHGVWTGRFGGDPNVIGRSLDLDGEPWTIIGVMPPDTPLLTFGVTDVDLWTPLPTDRPALAIGLLREGVDIEAAQARLAVPIDVGGVEVTGAPRRLSDMVSARLQDTLPLLLVAVSVVLLVACANVSNLLIGRAFRRRHETAVRAALGAGRARLARQLVFEGLTIGALGGALGLGLGFAGIRGLQALRPPALDALDRMTLDGRVLAFGLVLTFLASLLFSLAPALRSRREFAGSLRGGARSDAEARDGNRLRWGLVSAEVALSFALVVGASIVLSAFADLGRADPGFEADRALTVQVLPPAWRFDDGNPAAPVHALVQERLAALPGVERVALANGRPAAASVFFGTIEVEGRAATEETRVLHGPSVDADYFEALGQALVSGRAFEVDELRRDSRVAVLGEGAAREFFGDTDPVGRRMRIGEAGDWWTVIGVTNDVAMVGLAGDRPQQALQFYTPLGVDYPSPERTYFVRIAPGADLAMVTSAVRNAVRAHFPDARLEDMATMDVHLAGTLAHERFASTLVSLFTVLALTLAGVGLYGVVSQVVGQRTREIGIRMALGADRGRIGRLALRASALAALAGVLAGGLLAELGLDLLSSQLFGLDRGRAGSYAFAAVAIGALTLVASWVPVRRAMRVDPVRAMRAE